MIQTSDGKDYHYHPKCDCEGVTTVHMTYLGTYLGTYSTLYVDQTLILTWGILAYPCRRDEPDHKCLSNYMYFT